MENVKAELKEILKNTGASIEENNNNIFAKHHTCDNRSLKNVTKMINEKFTGLSIIANAFEIKIFCSDSLKLKRA